MRFYLNLEAREKLTVYRSDHRRRERRLHQLLPDDDRRRHAMEVALLLVISRNDCRGTGEPLNRSSDHWLFLVGPRKSLYRLGVVALCEANVGLKRGDFSLHGASLLSLTLRNHCPLVARLAAGPPLSLSGPLDVEVKLNGLIDVGLRFLPGVVVDLALLGQLVDDLLGEHMLALCSALAILDKQMIKVLKW